MGEHECYCQSASKRWYRFSLVTKTLGCAIPLLWMELNRLSSNNLWKDPLHQTPLLPEMRSAPFDASYTTSLLIHSDMVAYEIMHTSLCHNMSMIWSVTLCLPCTWVRTDHQADAIDNFPKTCLSLPKAKNPAAATSHGIDLRNH